MSAIILFDGVCNFCDNTVNFIIDKDSAGYFRFAPLQSETGMKLLEQYNIDSANTDSVILIENEKVFLHSTAALKIARRLDGIWRFAYVFIIVPSFIRNAAYKLFAKYRYKLFGKKDACMMPSPEIRQRFLA